MNETNTLKQLSVSFEEFRQRLAPLAILGYQAVALFALVVVGVLAYNWFQLPALGFQVTPMMVVGKHATTGSRKCPGMH